MLLMPRGGGGGGLVKREMGRLIFWVSNQMWVSGWCRVRAVVLPFHVHVMLIHRLERTKFSCSRAEICKKWMSI